MLGTFSRNTPRTGRASATGNDARDVCLGNDTKPRRRAEFTLAIRREIRILIRVDGFVGFGTEGGRIGNGRTARDHLRIRLSNIGFRRVRFWLGASWQTPRGSKRGRRAGTHRILRWRGDNGLFADARGERGPCARRGSGGSVKPIKGHGRHQEHRDNCGSEQDHRAFRRGVRPLRSVCWAGLSSGGLAPR
jgi:hypothetical protein